MGVSLNGTSQEVQCGDFTDRLMFARAFDWTFGMWAFNRSVTAAQREYGGKYGLAASAREFSWNSQSNGQLQSRMNNLTVFSMNGVLTQDVWQCLVTTFVQATNTLTTYVFDAGDPLNPAIGSGSPTGADRADNIGRLLLGARDQGAGSNFFNGIVAEGWYFRRTMSQAEITEAAFAPRLARRRFQPLNPDSNCFWIACGARNAAGEHYDLTGLGHDGVEIGSPTLGAHPPVNLTHGIIRPAPFVETGPPAVGFRPHWIRSQKVAA